MSADPTDTWRATFAASGLTTSEQLRQTQQALAASQADLTRVERERDEARAAVADVETHRKLASDRLTRAEAERNDLQLIADLLRAELAAIQQGKPCSWKDLAVSAMRERDMLRAQLDDRED